MEEMKYYSTGAAVIVNLILTVLIFEAEPDIYFREE